MILAEAGDEALDFLLQCGVRRQPLNPAFGNRRHPQCRTQKGTQHRAAVAIVAAGVGIGDQRGFNVIWIARRQIQHGGERMLDIAGGTEQAADHGLIGLMLAADALDHRRGREAQPFGSGARQRRDLA